MANEIEPLPTPPDFCEAFKLLERIRRDIEAAYRWWPEPPDKNGPPY